MKIDALNKYGDVCNVYYPEKQPTPKIWVYSIAIALIIVCIFGAIFSICIIFEQIPLNEYSVALISVTLGLPAIGKIISSMRK